MIEKHLEAGNLQLKQTWRRVNVTEQEHVLPERQPDGFQVVEDV